MEAPTHAPRLLTVSDAAALLALSRSKMYQLLRRGDLPSVQIDGSRRVRPEAVDAYVARLEDVNGTGSVA